MYRIARRKVGTPFTLILALVFPAMIAAAVALTYYGFKHAEDVARPVEQYFRLESQDYADSLARSVERSLDKEALALFEKIAVMQADPLTMDGCAVEAGTGIESFAVLGEAHRLVCSWPPPPASKRRVAGSPAPIPWEYKSKYLLDWSQVRMGNFAYHHEPLNNGGSALFAYTLRRDPNGDSYRVVARIRLDLLERNGPKKSYSVAPKIVGSPSLTNPKTLSSANNLEWNPARWDGYFGRDRSAKHFTVGVSKWCHKMLRNFGPSGS